MTSEQVFSINAAAKLTGYSLPTVRKRLPDLSRHGAVQVAGRWSIPLSALHTVGLMQRVVSNADKQVTSEALHSETINILDDLRGQLADALQRAAVAEALAGERERALERADRALLMLEGNTASRQPQAPRRGWLTRRDS
jgi:hypothetical protein